jgi:hypothetical protein
MHHLGGLKAGFLQKPFPLASTRKNTQQKAKLRQKKGPAEPKLQPGLFYFRAIRTWSTQAQQLPATSAAVAAATTEVAAVTTGLVFGNVDLDGTVVKLAAIQGQGLLGIFLVGKGHETKATAATGLPIGNDAGFFDPTVRGESPLQTGVVRTPSQATHEKFVLHVTSSFNSLNNWFREPTRKGDEQ